MKKVLCLVSHGIYEPWIQIFKEGQQVTWLLNPRPENFIVIHFHGTPVGLFGQKINALHERARWSNRFIASILRTVDSLLGFPFRNLIPSVTKSNILGADEQVFHVHQPDIYATYKWKEIGIFAYLLEHFKFDYIFTTTTSSYINPEVLVDVLNGKPSHNYYGGMIPYEGADFASGSNRVFSRDVIELIVRERASLSCGIIEDVSIAKLLREHGIIPDPLMGVNLENEEEILRLTNQDISRNYHFRLKSGTLEKRNDTVLFSKLHKILSRL